MTIFMKNDAQSKIVQGFWIFKKISVVAQTILKFELPS